MFIKKYGLILWLLLAQVFLASNISAGESSPSAKMPITTASKEARALYLEGRQLQENLNEEKAAEKFQQAIAKDKNFALAHAALASRITGANEALGHIAKAKALAGKVSKGEQLWIQAISQRFNGSPGGSIKSLNELAKMYPQDKRVTFALGNAMQWGGADKEEALAVYKKVIAQHPEYAPVYNSIGYLYVDLKLPELAEEAFKKYTQLIPENPNPYDSYAEFKLSQGDYRAAIELFKKALEKDPGFIISARGIASAHDYLGEHKEAQEYLDQAIARTSGYVDQKVLKEAKVVSLVNEGDYKGALGIAESILADAEKSRQTLEVADAHFLIGRLHLENKQYAKAKAWSAKAVKLVDSAQVPEQQSALIHLRAKFMNAWVAIDQGNDLAVARKMVADYRDAASGFPGNKYMEMGAREMDGVIAIKDGDYKSALAALSKADKDNAYVLYWTAVAQRGVGNEKAAGEYFARSRMKQGINNLDQAFVHNRELMAVAAQEL
ncbi:tetratricopeptide repeat protein [Biformimicrobium ophioploci]|uniref:Tetratricopeptide repeat protein n=1 Tax=Biformimicrobium ophioploci TaxID=3036711 RepID=A0ABQ6M101_9GAMM|nr:tetratricopeptide repeat protein [Microbulbifer sp. NKW57]GMG88008.1 hypothetical protein MNKW57_23290 [Microbulbifer sp. NKW57]